MFQLRPSTASYVSRKKQKSASLPRDDERKYKNEKVCVETMMLAEIWLSIYFCLWPIHFFALHCAVIVSSLQLE